jgi:hypothetical protein
MIADMGRNRKLTRYVVATRPLLYTISASFARALDGALFDLLEIGLLHL